MSENLKEFSNMYEKVNSIRNNTEKKKLAFEIAKYKFENPGFQFDSYEENWQLYLIYLIYTIYINKAFIQLHFFITEI